MFRQTTLNSKTQDKQKPSAELGQGVAELGHDLIELIELQFQLLAVDLRKGQTRAVAPIVLGVIAMLLFLGALPVLLFGAGWLLAVSTELTMPAAFTVVGAATLALSAILALIAYQRLTHISEIFERSQRELNSNLRWIKRTLKKMS